ncbi:MAG: chitobiase/beta-hexosaminidase C-terminal domain-containing protein [Bacteroidales bacterium]|nr:chitobiase/beta-hexosaminidase C-terminal domain-containing protein [Bacteroidales bacterium]
MPGFLLKTLFITAAVAATLSAGAEERSFTIAFGADEVSTNTLTNDDFVGAVRSGKSYIADVTSVVAVFPEKDGIKLSSSKTAGGFNIHLADGAQIVAKRIEVEAWRYDNQRDEDAGLYINSEPLDIPSLTPETYTVTLPTRPETTVTNLIVKADKRVYISSITVVYDSSHGTVDDERQTVATPVFTPGGGTVTLGTSIEIACATDGATIYYTLDGSEPTTRSEVYTGPIVADEDILLQAFASKTGMDDSETAFASYRVIEVGEGATAYTFNFAEPETLNPSIPAPAQGESVLLDGRTFSQGEVSVTFKAGETGNTHVRLYGSYDAGCDLRIYDGESMTVRSLNASLMITSIAYDISFSGTSDVDMYPSAGRYDWLDTAWYADGETVTDVTLTSIQQSRMSAMTVVVEPTSGVDDVAVDAPADAVYVDMTGRRIGAGALVPGVYVRVAGEKAEKIVVN